MQSVRVIVIQGILVSTVMCAIMMIAKIIVIYKRIEMPWVPWLVWNLLFIALVNPVLFYESIFHQAIVLAAPGLFPNWCHILIPMGFSWFSSLPKPLPLNTPFLKPPPLKTSFSKPPSPKHPLLALDYMHVGVTFLLQWFFSTFPLPPAPPS